MRLPRPALAHRLRLLLAARPLAYWTATAALITVTVLALNTTASSALRARRAWGTAHPTLVATRAIAPGDALGDANTTVRLVPDALRPAGALASRPPGAVAAAAIVAGEPVVAARLHSGGSHLPPGTRGMAVPRGDTSLALQPGDGVDVLAAVTTRSGEPRRVATGVVVDVAARSVVVAVPEAEAPAVAQALADGAAVLALRP